MHYRDYDIVELIAILLLGSPMKGKLRIKVRLVGELATKYGDYIILEFDSEPTSQIFIKELALRLGISESSIKRDYMIVFNGKTKAPQKISSNDNIEIVPIFFGG